MGLAHELSDISVGIGFIPQALSGTSDIVGAIIDTRNYESLEFTLITDAIAASSLSAVLLIEEGAASDLADAAAVADADLTALESTTAITQASDSVALSIGYTGSKRYVRPTLTVSANDGTDVVACTAILGNKKQI